MAKRNASLPAASGANRKLRCAIYTRKSTEEGLEQEFNSLDAQYEACAAYIMSQRHEGWSQTKERYDDGGFSGGTMERPGIRQLLADVALGKVDIIVVYKVDRLTRSLADFAKIVEILDGRSASFVSVTQAFNTTTSMGRLTLNVLLSFAQFEREVTGERIRDKIAASRKKGMWMGGTVPLGYEVQDRALVINIGEAETVRHIFTQYLALGSGAALIEELHADGYRTRTQVYGDKVRGGVPFSRGMLFHLLSNPVYIGKIVHHDALYDGLHAPIVEQNLWDAVQAKIAANRTGNIRHERAHHSSPLAGLLRDGHGRAMSPSHANKDGKRYRYYVTHASERLQGDAPAWRLPAFDVEAAVIARMKTMLLDPTALNCLLPRSIPAQQLSQAILAARGLAERLDSPHGRRSTLPTLLREVRMGDDELSIKLDSHRLAQAIGQELVEDDASFILTAPATKIRAGKATKLVIGNQAPTTVGYDEKLVALLAEARQAREAVRAAPTTTIKDLARQRKQCRHRLAKLVRLSWLSPKIVTLIMAGGQPASLTPMKLQELDLPLSWAVQEQLLLAV